jgi:two-component system nitrogen regulation sensor histidine kinase NtrY
MKDQQTVIVEPVEEVNLPQEHRKRKREIVAIFLISFLVVFLTWFEIRLFSISQQLPFVHSIFFFGLVNVNIILLILLCFLIFRNVVKVFLERKSKIFGSSLKSKLIAAFVAFSSIPTILLFVISVFYINASFEKWFSLKMVGVLKSSLEIQNSYYFTAKKKNYHFAHEIEKQLQNPHNWKTLPTTLDLLRNRYALDAIEIYKSVDGDRVYSMTTDESLYHLPIADPDFIRKGLVNRVESSTIQQFGDGNLVRVIVPLKTGSKVTAAAVVSSFVPLSLTSRMNDVSAAYEEFRDVNPLESPLKSIYVIVLFMMTLVILFAAVWFGFYLAKQISIPLVQLGRATRKVASGDYSPVQVNSGSEEVTYLVDNFNQMTENLDKTTARLEETAKYIEVVLGHISTGVISVDKDGIITTLNQHAADLLKINRDTYVGRPVRELLTTEYFRLFAELLKNMQEYKLESIRKELTVNVGGESLPLSLNLSILKGEHGEELGKVLVFDDLSPIVSAQRSAAWTEVARRIAHEIKNPLTPIKLAAERLHRKFASQIDDPAFKDSIQIIVKQVDDMKNLVNEFSQFARLPQAKMSPGIINDVASEIVSLFSNAHGNIQFKTEFDQNTPVFKFDSDQIKRVLTNLVDNAVAACSKATDPAIYVKTEYDTQLKTLRITVADNGIGIPSQDRQRIFEPYYSTKDGGTGLGLSIVKRVIEDHNGYIRTIPNEPQGTRMVVELPVLPVEGWRPKNDQNTDRG